MKKSKRIDLKLVFKRTIDYKIIKNLNIITDKDIEEQLGFSGIGACGSISKVLNEYGYGKIMNFI